MSALVPFNFDGSEVRVLEIAGEPWFVAADLCRALGLTNPTVAAQALDDDERAKFNLGRQGEATIVSESGAYTLILRCRAATTPGSVPHRVRRWITSEVLPSIRKTGGYGTPDLRDPATLLSLLTTYAQDKLELQGQVMALQPKADALDRISAAEGDLGLIETAKLIGVQVKTLTSDLQARGWIYRRSPTAPWLGRADKVAAGRVKHAEFRVPRRAGGERLCISVKFPPKAIPEIAGFYAPSSGELFR